MAEVFKYVGSVWIRSEKASVDWIKRTLFVC